MPSTGASNSRCRPGPTCATSMPSNRRRMPSKVSAAGSRPTIMRWARSCARATRGRRWRKRNERASRAFGHRMKSAVTISLVPEARGGPFVFSNGLADGFARAAALGYDAVEIFPPGVDHLDAAQLRQLSHTHGLVIAAIGTGGGWVKHQLRLTDP